VVKGETVGVGCRQVEERGLRRACRTPARDGDRIRLVDGQHDNELRAGEATARSAAVVVRDESDAAQCRDRVRRRVAADAEQVGKVTRAQGRDKASVGILSRAQDEDLERAPREWPELATEHSRVGGHDELRVLAADCYLEPEVRCHSSESARASSASIARFGTTKRRPSRRCGISPRAISSYACAREIPSLRPASSTDHTSRSSEERRSVVSMGTSKRPFTLYKGLDTPA
jgi:hypothetical protein